jgi:S-adenosylmethionine:tRNA ribosyltransferase-isomerase
VRIDAFAYDLPPELIAQRPPEDREAARLMLLPRGRWDLEHRRVGELAELLPPGALVVVNDTRVIPARLLGNKATGGRVEVFLVEKVGVAYVDVGGTRQPAEQWRALGKSSKPLQAGLEIEVRARGATGGPARLVVRLLGRADDGLLEVALRAPGGEPIDEALRACGHVPLPPYIKRGDEADDAIRYQTVYARSDGAVAAPTAGLHLTEALLDRIRQRGCTTAAVTLHVGLGTFRPVDVEDLDHHPMHAERCVVPPSTVEAIDRAREGGRPVVAVGTTTVRALEAAADPQRRGHVRAFEGETRLLIQPGYPWSVVDALLTNFHLPESTLLAMVCAFGGTERVLGAYRAAVEGRYRFFSYGDAMLLWRSA